jgi:uncharacterized protein YjbI with pentapeptide repeats/energy-coupling factor transporter ATP-binding protein EcfA2
VATGRRSISHAHSRDPHGDIFPVLGLFIGCGAFVGAIIAILGQSADNLLIQVALSTGLGAILGLFVGLSRAVWRSREILILPGSESLSDCLWDPWLDNGHDVADVRPASKEEDSTGAGSSASVEAIHRLSATGAHVRPRVWSLETGEAIRLEDEIGRLIQKGHDEQIGLIGGPGSGKTTALRHLATVLPPWAVVRVKLVDDPREYTDIVAGGDDHAQFVISAGSQLPADPRRLSYHLTSWSQDDLIEYLLAVHGNHCASVMSRLKAAGDGNFIQGIPELWTVVLDQMALDESVDSVRTALTRVLEAWFTEHPDVRQFIEDFCILAIGKNFNLVLNIPHSKLTGETPQKERHVAELLRLIRHRPVGLLLAARQIASGVEKSFLPSIDLSLQLPYDLIKETARLIAGNTLALEHLRAWINRKDRDAVHPLAASLLHMIAPGWRPGPDCRPRLNGAYLARAAWSGVDLAGVDLESVDLNEADLNSANLERSLASRAQLQGADLRRAVLDSCVAIHADLGKADLRAARATAANFQRASLAGARLMDADLRRADLQKADIEDADFTSANLEKAILKGLKLSLALFSGARFGGADMRDCNLENLVLTTPDFHSADLRGALLTGSRMQQANFLGANLGNAGLAEIDWPDADLRNSDLRGASFHLGSSRSGLVGSPIACEGSRTGFYTDDYDDHEIKPADEIRKANLRGADLRGAEVEGVDFYLVDLREAQYTQVQGEHFRHCRAILDDCGG